jgi:hypothetical protein
LYDVAVEKLAGLQGLRGGSRSEREEAGARARIIMAAQSGHRSETGVFEQPPDQAQEKSRSKLEK